MKAPTGSAKCSRLTPRDSTGTRKLAIYAREGVTHAWLLDPLQRTLEVLRLDRQQWVIVAVHAGDEEVRVEPFDAVSLAPGRLWVD